MKYTKEIYDRLIRGKFISSDVEAHKIWFDAIESDYDAYTEYFSQIGYNLEMENGYCYFSRQETNSEFERKLQNLCKWIDCLELLKSCHSGFGRDFRFYRYELEQTIHSDMELCQKALPFSGKDNSIEKAIDNIISELMDADFVECLNEADGQYRVTAAFGYIESVINSITIEKSKEDEIPE